MRILIVDDHPLVREGIALMIRRCRPDAQLIAADSCATASAHASRQAFDLVFLDLNLPDQPGFVALQTFRTEHPETPVVVISGQEDRETVIRSLDLGAKAFVPKSADSSKIQDALRTVLDDRVYLPHTLTDTAPTEPWAAIGGGDALPWPLTGRQIDVLALLVSGLPNKLIARRLEIVESTVKIHVSAVLKALKVASRTQAIIAVAKAGVRLPTP